MNVPKAAWNDVWIRKRRSRIFVVTDQVKRRAAAGGGSSERRGPSAGGFGRNSDATAEVALVAATTRNGRRTSDIPTSSPPTVGPSTAPADPAAERTPFAKASRARSIAWATYSRSETWLTPDPSPASE